MGAYLTSIPIPGIVQKGKEIRDRVINTFTKKNRIVKVSKEFSLYKADVPCYLIPDLCENCDPGLCCCCCSSLSCVCRCGKHDLAFIGLLWLVGLQIMRQLELTPAYEDIKRYGSMAVLISIIFYEIFKFIFYICSRCRSTDKDSSPSVDSPTTTPTSQVSKDTSTEAFINPTYGDLHQIKFPSSSEDSFTPTVTPTLPATPGNTTSIALTD